MPYSYKERFKLILIGFVAVVFISKITNWNNGGIFVFLVFVFLFYDHYLRLNKSILTSIVIELNPAAINEQLFNNFIKNLSYEDKTQTKFLMSFKIIKDFSKNQILICDDATGKISHFVYFDIHLSQRQNNSEFFLLLKETDNEIESSQFRFILDVNENHLTCKLVAKKQKDFFTNIDDAIEYEAKKVFDFPIVEIQKFFEKLIFSHPEYSKSEVLRLPAKIENLLNASHFKLSNTDSNPQIKSAHGAKWLVNSRDIPIPESYRPYHFFKSEFATIGIQYIYFGIDFTNQFDTTE